MWRLAYNAGLGYVLKRQSETRWIVRTVKRNGWFDEKRQPKIAQWAKNELKKKMGKDYDFTVRVLTASFWQVTRLTKLISRPAVGPSRIQRKPRVLSRPSPSARPRSSLTPPRPVTGLDPFPPQRRRHPSKRLSLLRPLLALVPDVVRPARSLGPVPRPALGRGVRLAAVQPLGQDGCAQDRQGLCVRSLSSISFSSRRVEM